MDGWMGGWMDGWMGVKARLRIAYSNQQKACWKGGWVEGRKDEWMDGWEKPG